MVSSNRSHPGSANPNSPQQSERHRHGRQPHQGALRLQPGHCSEPANPLATSVDKARPSLKLLSLRLWMYCHTTATHNSLLFPAPRHRPLPAP